MKSRRTLLRFILLLTLLLNAACSKKGRSPDSGKDGRNYAAWPALALLQTGENPLWFELEWNGPSLIESPAAAALAPNTPWPYARCITGILAWEGSLVMAVNRDGFFILCPAAWSSWSDANTKSTDLVLYRAADTLWDNYTTESFFIWGDRPAALLYRNDFFSEPDALPLAHQVFVLDKSSAVPLPVSVPALEKLSDGWEAEVLRRGSDGFWYYRMKEKNKTQNETAFFCAVDLSEEGKKISLGDWRNSGNPEKPRIPKSKASHRDSSHRDTSLHITAVLDKAQTFGSAEFGLGGVSTARVISPDFEGQRFFVSENAALDTDAFDAENAAVLYGFCRNSPEPLALVILPDGRGLYSFGAQEALINSFSLPSLPQGFVYSGIALLGEVLAASWEEQKDASIGAAGFMVMALGSKLRFP
jgi:hypothetical protein